MPALLEQLSHAFEGVELERGGCGPVAAMETA
jgi:hypothetical protein